MSKRDLKELSTANEIDLTVRGRKSGLDISRLFGILTPLQKFMFGLKSSETRRQYPKLLLKFVDFLKLQGTRKQCCSISLYQSLH